MRQTSKKKDGQRDTERGIGNARKRERQTGRKTDRQRDRKTDRQRDGKTDKQKDRQAERQKETDFSICRPKNSD